MRSVSAGEARGQFAEVVNRAAYGRERVIVTRRGKALAAIVPIEDACLLEEMEDRLDVEEARVALAEAAEKGTIPLESLLAEFEID